MLDMRDNPEALRRAARPLESTVLLILVVHQKPARRFTSGVNSVGSHLNPPSPVHSQSSGSRRRSGTHARKIKDVLVFDGNFLCLAKLHCPFEIFMAGVDVPVGDEGISITALQQAFLTS